MRTRLAAAITAALLSACAGTPPQAPPAATPAAAAPDFTADYRALAAGSEGRVFAIDPQASRVRIYAFRGGKAAAAGHNHVLSVPALHGFAYVPQQLPGGARFDLRFRLDELLVDDPLARQEAGGSFATPLSADAVRDTRAHMLGERNLDAAHYPEVLIHSVAVAGELPRLVATVALTLHGTTRELLLPLEVQQQGDELRVDGALAIRQSDFGAAPYSVLGGLIAVEDEIAVNFGLRARLLHHEGAP